MAPPVHVGIGLTMGVLSGNVGFPFNVDKGLIHGVVSENGAGPVQVGIGLITGVPSGIVGCPLRVESGCIGGFCSAPPLAHVGKAVVMPGCSPGRELGT